MHRRPTKFQRTDTLFPSMPLVRSGRAVGAPRLFAGRRRPMAAGLAALALCQAVAAVLFAEAIDALLQAQPWPGLHMVSLIGGLALLASLILLAEIGRAHV